MALVPDGLQVAAFLGGSDDLTLVALAGEHVAIIAAMARAYTRDNGFTAAGEVTEDLAAVIVTATARLLGNPEQVDSNIGGVRVGAGFAGWSLAETFVLNRYRRRVK